MTISGTVSDRLKLHPMGDIENAPPTLSFDRPRTIALPWADLAATTATTAKKSLERATDTLRADLEASWGYDPNLPRTKEDVKNILADGLLVTQEKKDDGPLRFMPLQEEGGGTFPDKIGVFAKHNSGRWYRLLAENDLVIENFNSSELYKAAWESVIGLELVKDTYAEVPSEATSTEYIDLRAPFIETRYKELVLLRNIAAASYSAAKATFDKAASELNATEEDKQNYISAANELDRLEQSLKTLARQASEMGYTIFVEPVPTYKTVKDADGKDVLAAVQVPAITITLRTVDAAGKESPPKTEPAVFGKLYRRTVESRTYTPTHTVFSVVGWLFPRVRRRTISLPPVTQNINVHVEVDTLREPHRERIAELTADQFEVHVCSLTDNGYETENGMPLELVMVQCDADEMTRLRTVVFIPSYDYRLTGERVLTGYTIFHRPAAGSMPVAFPELSVRESMEYRTTWLKTEVGELVKSINLAPGERRQITVTRTFQQETTETKTASSVFDLASSESSDLSTELERTARNETDVTDKTSASATASASVSASGSYSAGPVSGSASASASTSGSINSSRDKSVKNVGTDMAKSAQKAARSVNQSRKEEVSSSSTSRTTVSTSDISISEIENINKGRTLNLMFYRLYNRYIGKLYLTDLRLTVRSGTEIIAGSGILSERTYSIHELREVVRALSNTPLPIDADEQSNWELQLAILREIGNLIAGEYAKLTAAESGEDAELKSDNLLMQLDGNPANSADEPKNIFQFGKGIKDEVDALREMSLLTPSRSKAETDKSEISRLEGTFNKKINALIKDLEPMEVRGLPVNATELLVAAEGLFLDAQVGSNPSTEPYSEKMRDAEVLMRHAEIARVRSESARNEAMAQYMGFKNLEGSQNSIVEASVSGKALEVELMLPLEGENWTLEYDRHTVSGKLINPGGRMIAFDFGRNTPQWASNTSFDLLELVDSDNGSRIPFKTALQNLVK